MCVCSRVCARACVWDWECACGIGCVFMCVGVPDLTNCDGIDADEPDLVPVEWREPTPAELAAHEAAHHSFFVHSAAKATSAVPRCDKCTLPVPCGKVHATKRTYAEVRESSCTACIAYAMTPRVCHCRWSHPNKKIHATMMQHGVCRRRRSQSARGSGRLQ